MQLDPDVCYRALCSHDSRFDGLFFVGVKTTGIYCRPICRAITPKKERCVFYEYAHSAEKDGFRACFRCRPEIGPKNSNLKNNSTLATLVLARIEEGFLNHSSVNELASVLNVSERHLRRIVKNDLGSTPSQIAQSKRLALAKQLLQDSPTSIADIAFASGFSSIRRFNSLFRDHFGKSPTQVRRAVHSTNDNMVLRLGYRQPFHWDSWLTFLSKRAVFGFESVKNNAYLRTVQIGENVGWIRIQNNESSSNVFVEVSQSLQSVLMSIVSRVRKLCDLDSQPTIIDDCLQRDAVLSSWVRARPGLRIPGAFDGFETTVRAILGQQVSVKAAVTLCRRLVERFGKRIKTEHSDLCFLFPTPNVIADTSEIELTTLGIPIKRAKTLLFLAREVSNENICFTEASRDLVRLRQIAGIGEWTIQYLLMRVFGWPDAFPSTDLEVRKALGGISPKDASNLVRNWQPWRSYGVLHLWTRNA